MHFGKKADRQSPNRSEVGESQRLSGIGYLQPLSGSCLPTLLSAASYQLNDLQKLIRAHFFHLHAVSQMLKARIKLTHFYCLLKVCPKWFCIYSLTNYIYRNFIKRKGGVFQSKTHFNTLYKSKIDPPNQQFASPNWGRRVAIGLRPEQDGSRNLIRSGRSINCGVSSRRMRVRWRLEWGVWEGNKEVKRACPTTNIFRCVVTVVTWLTGTMEPQIYVAKWKICQVGFAPFCNFSC